MIHRRLLLACLATSTPLPAAPSLQAQGVARQEPLKLIVGYPAGGSADAVARMLADKLKDGLNTTVIVDNRPGAGGAIAAEYVKNAPADGYTILIANTHMMVMIPLTFKVVRYNPVKDFQPFGRVSSFYEAIAVPSAMPATTVAQWIDLARANKKAVACASSTRSSGWVCSRRPPRRAPCCSRCRPHSPAFWR